MGGGGGGQCKFIRKRRSIIMKRITTVFKNPSVEDVFIMSGEMPEEEVVSIPKEDRSRRR